MQQGIKEMISKCESTHQKKKYDLVKRMINSGLIEQFAGLGAII